MRSYKTSIDFRNNTQNLREDDIDLAQNE